MNEGTVEDSDVVHAAVDAAEDVIFSRIDRRNIEDMDVTVSFVRGQLDVDVYLNAPDSRVETHQVAKDATLAAGRAVDSLLE